MEIHPKDYDSWNRIKKSISTRRTGNIFPKEREAWICSLGINIGIEQHGTSNDYTRHILIVKKFSNQMVWGIPLSTKQKTLDFYHNFTDPEGNEVSAVIAQMRLFSSKRLLRRIYKLDGEKFNKIKKHAKMYLE